TRPEGRPVPEHAVAGLQHDRVRPDRRRDTVHLEDPAARAPGRVAADLVDVRPEAADRHETVELAGQAGGLQSVERVGLDRERRLGRAEDRLRLALYPYVHAESQS